MPDVEAGLVVPWGVAAQLEAGVLSPWGVAAQIENVSTAYTPPPPPEDGEFVVPNDLTAATSLGVANTYRQAHTAQVIDLRDNAVLPVARLSMDLQDGSDLWTLSATSAPDAGGALFQRLTDRSQMPAVRVTIDGLSWAFLVENVSRPRTDGGKAVTFGGRSLAAVADAPFQLPKTYSADAPTTAAQLAASALLAAGVELEWKLVDWIIPEGALSLTATPLGVVRALAAAVGAVVEAHPSEAKITVRSRYESLPNEWAYQQPDVQIRGEALVADTYEVADKPAYTGIFVAGQQTGGLTYVKLEGTNGSDQAPMVSDALLTEEAARVERARAELGAGGQQARVSITLPVRVGAGQPGVLQRGALVRVVDDGEIWHAACRSVNVSIAMPGSDASGFSLRQTVSFERHTKHIVDPQTAEPLVFEGPIPDQTAYVGEAFSLDLTPFRSEGLAPYTWTLRTGTLPPGIAPAGETLSGTPTAGRTAQAVSLRVTDAVAQMQDTTPFNITVQSKGPVWQAGAVDAGTAFTAAGAGYGDGVFVCFNAASTTSSSVFKRSADGGKTWQTITTGLTPKQCARVAYGNGAWVITTGNAATDRATYRSTNGGLTWTYQATALPSSGFWYATAFGNGRFLSARWSTNVLAVSTDGLTWTTRTLPATKNWWNVVWTGTRWLLTSRTDRIVYASEDNGETWSVLSTVPGSGTLGTVWASGGLVFAGQFSTPSTEMWVSADNGATWQAVTLPQSTANYLVFYVESQAYWMMLRLVSGFEDQVLTSIDGLNWIVSPNALTFKTSGVGRAYGGGAAVAVNFNGGASYAHFPGSMFL